MAEKHLFCFGHGYSCNYVGYELMQRGGWRVSGTSRDPDKVKELRARGVNAVLFDEENHLPDALHIMRDVTHVLISTPPSSSGDVTFNVHANDILGLQNVEWVGYLSTTSPYGDKQGEWVDENTAPNPTTRRGNRRLRVEQEWLSLCETHNLPVHIFRLAGIYGPGRSALDSVRSGIARRIDKPGHAFSRIHVEDLSSALIASMLNPSPGQIYNICDDYPAPSHEVIDYACQLLNIQSPPLIPFDKIDLAPIALSFYMDNKRVRNDKMKRDLGVQLKYPSYKEGLQGCLEAELYAQSLQA